MDAVTSEIRREYIAQRERARVAQEAAETELLAHARKWCPLDTGTAFLKSLRLRRDWERELGHRADIVGECVREGLAIEQRLLAIERPV